MLASALIRKLPHKRFLIFLAFRSSLILFVSLLIVHLFYNPEIVRILNQKKNIVLLHRLKVKVKVHGLRRTKKIKKIASGLLQLADKRTSFPFQPKCQFQARFEGILLHYIKSGSNFIDFFLYLFG